MAAALGVTPQTVHNYLRGTRQPMLGMIKQWALVCSVPWQWITTGELPDGPNDGGEGVSAPVTLRPPRVIRPELILLKHAA